jgi:hypothetical protein
MTWTAKFEHLLGDFFIRNVTEIIRFFANLVGITDGARHALAARFGQYDPAFLFLIAAWTPKARRSVSPSGAM